MPRMMEVATTEQGRTGGETLTQEQAGLFPGAQRGPKEVLPVQVVPTTHA